MSHRNEALCKRYLDIEEQGFRCNVMFGKAGAVMKKKKTIITDWQIPIPLILEIRVVDTSSKQKKWSSRDCLVSPENQNCQPSPQPEKYGGPARI
ncbi:MAG: hypothetical protein WB919_23630 [Candidatus Sulfotelmatobacter sp.]